MIHKQYLIFGNYGTFEGWKILGDADSIEEITEIYLHETGQYSCEEYLVVRNLPITFTDLELGPSERKS